MKKLIETASSRAKTDMVVVDDIFKILLAIGTDDRKKIKQTEEELNELIITYNADFKATIAKLMAAELTLIKLGKVDKYHKMYKKLIKELV